MSFFHDHVFNKNNFEPGLRFQFLNSVCVYCEIHLLTVNSLAENIDIYYQGTACSRMLQP